MEDKGSDAFLTLATYEESLLQDQTNQKWDGEAILYNNEQQIYNLRSKGNNVKENLAQRAVVSIEQQIQSSSKHQFKR